MFNCFSILILITSLSCGSPELLQPRAPAAAPTYSSCVLVAVYTGHFRHLGAFLALAQELLVDRPPIYVIFDTPSDVEDFCKSRSHLCNAANFHPRTLQALLGTGLYHTSRRFIFEDIRPYPGQFFNTGNSSHGCEGQVAGRVYQSLKKFYGVRGLEQTCKTVFVADAESYPFRKSNFSHQMRVHVQQPRLLIPTWATDWEGCRGSMGRDGACKSMIARLLGIRESWQPSSPSQPAVLATAAQRLHYYGQTLPIHYDAFWVYEPWFMRALIDFSENATGQPLPLFFPSLRVFETEYIETIALHFAARGWLQIASLPVELSRHFAESWSKCCSCHLKDRPGYVFNGLPMALRQGEPCALLGMVSTGCLGSSVGLPQLGRWFVEKMGIFAASSMVFDSNISRDFVTGEEGIGLTWCVNNCMSGRVTARILFLVQLKEARLIREHVAPVAWEAPACLGVPVAREEHRALEVLLSTAKRLLTDRPPIVLMFSSSRDAKVFCDKRPQHCNASSIHLLHMSKWELEIQTDAQEVHSVHFPQIGTLVRVCDDWPAGPCHPSTKSLHHALMTSLLLWLVGDQCEAVQVVSPRSFPVKKTNFTRQVLEALGRPRGFASWWTDFGGCGGAEPEPGAVGLWVEPARIYRTWIMADIRSKAMEVIGRSFPACMAGLGVNSETFMKVFGAAQTFAQPSLFDESSANETESMWMMKELEISEVLGTSIASLPAETFQGSSGLHFTWCKDCLRGGVPAKLHRLRGVEHEVIRRALSSHFLQTTTG